MHLETLLLTIHPLFREEGAGSKLKHCPMFMSFAKAFTDGTGFLTESKEHQALSQRQPPTEPQAYTDAEKGPCNW